MKDNKHLSSPAQPGRWQRRGSLFLAGILGALASLLAAYLVAGPWGMETTDARRRPKPSERTLTMESLLARSPGELARTDVAEMNLLAAGGLPGSETIDVQGCLQKLDDWAERVRTAASAGAGEFRANPSKFNGSQPLFQMRVLVKTLRDLGVRFDASGAKVDYSQPRTIFIHGLLEQGAGNNLSLPVLCASVGRRLGYPLRLALVGAQLLLRWTDGTKDLQVELTGENVMLHEVSSPASSPIRAAGRTAILSGAEELAFFLSLRGRCLMRTGRIHEAEVAFAHAHNLARSEQAYLAWLADCVRLEERPGPTVAGGPVEPGGPGRAPADPFEELRRIQAMNAQHQLAMPPSPGPARLPPGSVRGSP